MQVAEEKTKGTRTSRLQKQIMDTKFFIEFLAPFFLLAN